LRIPAAGIADVLKIADRLVLSPSFRGEIPDFLDIGLRRG
jgi:hypothetical protein